MFLFPRAMDLANGLRDDIQQFPMVACQQPQPFKSTEGQVPQHGNTASVSRNLTSHKGPSKLLDVLQLCTVKAPDNDMEDFNCHSACCKLNLKGYE